MHGNVVRMTFFDVNGRSCANKNGIAELRMEYNNAGNLLRVSKLDITGKEIQTIEGEDK